MTVEYAPAPSHASAPQRTAAVAAAAAVGGEYLTFRLGAEEYGIDILRVQEIRSYEKPTTIANAPEHLKGVVNLRGVIVPIIDLRIKLGVSEVQYNHLTVVIVLNIGKRVIGVVVDGVSDVLTLEPSQLRPVPALDSNFDPEHILAIGSVDERMLILLDIEKFLEDTVLGVPEATLQ